MLAYPTTEGAFILDTNTSNTGIGAVLSQARGGEEKVVAYFSRSLTKAERRYCVTRKELLTLVTAVRHFHHYVYGRHFKMRADHGVLKWVMNFKNPEGQTARLIEILGIYDLEVEHRQRRIHGNADGLARCPCTNCSHCERGETKGQCADQLNEELVGHEDGEDDDEYCCATATKKKEGSGTYSWLPKLSNAEMREAQLQAIIKLKEENAEQPSWEMISMVSPTFKSY